MTTPERQVIEVILYSSSSLDKLLVSRIEYHCGYLLVGEVAYLFLPAAISYQLNYDASASKGVVNKNNDQ